MIYRMVAAVSPDDKDLEMYKFNSKEDLIKDLQENIYGVVEGIFDDTEENVTSEFDEYIQDELH